MAIYSLNIKIQSRGKGKSAISVAAYIAGERFKNEYDGIVHDRSDRNDVVHSEIVLPENAPEEFYDRAVLWNTVELSERAKNAQLARSVRIALPKEFTLEQNINLVKAYVNENFVRRGMCADFGIHDKGDDNVHAHVLLTMRPLKRDGTFGAKSRMEYILNDNGEKIKLPSGRYKTRKIRTVDWDNHANAEMWRENWANILNKYLEFYEYKDRVDHRSYERQGLEILPTIHLGAVSHEMEKKGIRTERGDINRAIKEKNERLKNLNNDIRAVEKERHEILNPPKPKFMIDLENSIKAKESPGYEHWARIFNLQQAARTLIFFQQSGFADFESLQTEHQKLKNNYAEIKNKIREISAEIINLKLQKEQAEIYRKTKDIYKEYTAKNRFTKNKFYEKHKTEIESHIKANAYIFDELKLEKFPSLKKLSEKISDSAKQEKILRENSKATRQKISNLSVAEHNAKMLLGYKEIESTAKKFAVSPESPCEIPICKENFDVAKSKGKLVEYYKNCRVNNDCANAIDEAIQKCKCGENEYKLEEAAKAVTAEFGKERVEYVLAGFINDEPADKFTKHKKWASQKNKSSEPQNIQINTHPVLLDVFTERLIDVSNRKPSFKESMARMEQRMKEREESRVHLTPSKKSKSNEHDLD